MSRGIKIKTKCALHGGWVFHTFYHAQANGFVCRKCGEWLDKNPDFKKLPFKGWGFYPPKGSGRETDAPGYRRKG